MGALQVKRLVNNKFTVAIPTAISYNCPVAKAAQVSSRPSSPTRPKDGKKTKLKEN